MGHRAVVEQSGVIAYRIGASGVEVLLVSNRRGTRWVVPKGNLEDGLSAAESAGKEAAEEAGAVGFVDEFPVGSYRYEKGGRIHEVALYPMRVMRLRSVWEEKGERERVWAPAEEAARVVAWEGLGEAIEAFGAMVGAVEAAA